METTACASRKWLRPGHFKRNTSPRTEDRRQKLANVLNRYPNVDSHIECMECSVESGLAKPFATAHSAQPEPNLPSLTGYLALARQTACGSNRRMPLLP